MLSQVWGGGEEGNLFLYSCRHFFNPSDRCRVRVDGRGMDQNLHIELVKKG
jgi:hypothetical protein